MAITTEITIGNATLRFSHPHDQFIAQCSCGGVFSIVGPTGFVEEMRTMWRTMHSGPGHEPVGPGVPCEAAKPPRKKGKPGKGK